MPPDAISRSRTYFPKIWGNTLAHRTALLALPLVFGCRTVPGPDITHTIRAHWITGCAPTDTKAVQIDLAAAGDFDPSPDTFATLTGKDGEAPLVAPVTTQAVVLEATDRFSEWSGLGVRGPGGDTDVALWPKRSAC